MAKWNDVKDKLILVEGWARDGLTNEQIADNLGINQDTLYTYKKKYPEFSEALKKGKGVNTVFADPLTYNYTRMFQDGIFIQSMKNTFFYLNKLSI